MKTLAVIGPPGGARKAETTLGLACHWAKGGDRVLLVDFDPLGRLTGMLGGEAASPVSSADVLLGRVGISEAVQPSRYKFDFLRSGRLLAAFHPFAPRAFKVAEHWKKALREAGSQYDLCLVSTPRESGRVLFSAALEAAEAALTLVEPASFGLRGVEDTLRRVRRAARGVPQAVWISLLGFQPRSPLSHNFLVGLRSRFGEHLLQTIVPVSGEHPHQSVRSLAAELDQRMSGLAHDRRVAELVRSSGS